MKLKINKPIIRVLSVVTAVLLLAGALPFMGNGQESADKKVVALTNQWNSTIDTSDNGEIIPNEYIVKTKDGDIKLVKTRKNIESLIDDGDVEAVEPNRIVTAMGQKTVSSIIDQDVAVMQYGDEMVRAGVAKELLPSETATVRVAVIDTGIDATHPDLAGKVVKGTTILDANSSGNKYKDDGNDDNGHGTHVAGIIAATWDNGIGIDGVTGELDIELMPVKALDDSGRGSTYDIIEGIRYAADNGAAILNLSLGSSASSSLEAEAVRYAQNKGCLVIAAAGNDSVDVAQNWPASYDGVISVGSVDAQGERSYFSNYGDTLDVAAPGTDIISTIPKKIALQESAYGSTVYGNDIDGYYISWSGTSMATPHVVGVAAIYKAANPGVTGDDIGELLINTCQDAGDVGKDIETGSGIVDAAAMLGAEVVKTPIKIKSPTAGSELYEEVMLTAQVNPTMDITKLTFYLDEETPENIIGEAECDENNSFYEIVWDTKNNTDGDHTVLAAVYDASGNQVGETQKVKINILNTITDGFTLQVTDPEQNNADSASYQIYGINSDGAYKSLKSGTTTDLGYSRVKGLSPDFTEYMLVISGKYTAAAGNNAVYYYNKQITAEALGSTLKVTGSAADKISTEVKDINGNPFTTYYIKIALANGVNGWLSSFPVVSMNSDTEIYMSEGVYRAQAYKSADEKGRAYYLEEKWEITSLNKECSIDASGAAKITADYPIGVEGTMELSGYTIKDQIPFLSGTISGEEVYVSVAGEFAASARMIAEQDDQEWQISMEKQDPVFPDGEDIVLEFKPDIKVTGFKLKGLREDEEGGFVYVGDSVSSENIFGDQNGDIIVQAAQTYPTFRIYKVEDNQRQLIYSKADRGNSSSSFWNSRNMYDGNVPPGAGEYVAQLSYSAGPFGGESVMEESFRMKTKSGGEEMTSTITMDGIYNMSRARMDLYSWNEEDDQWQKATVKALAEADENGVIRNIALGNITLGDSGINVAVIEFNGRKQGYQLPGEYIGFTTVPFSILDELEEIDISSETLKTLSVGITDQYGNRKSGNYYLPVISDGGKLAAAETVTDIELGIGNAANMKIYIPEGQYSYAYSKFNDSEANYLLTNGEFDTADTDAVKLDGQNTKTLTLDIDGNYRSGKVLVQLQGAADGVSCSTSVSDLIRLTPAEYSVAFEAKDRGNNYQYRVNRDNQLDMSEDATWKIGASFVPEVNLNQSAVAENQMLLGKMNFRDGYGNSLTEFKVKNDGFYEATYPTVTVGATGVGEQTFSLDKNSGYSSFAIDPAYYYGEGPHYMNVSYDLGQGVQRTSNIPFVVGLDYMPKLETDAADGFDVVKKSDGEIKFTATTARSYMPVTVALNTSSRERNVTFEQYRNGKLIKTVTARSIFAEKDSNTLSVYLQIRPGDEISVIAK